MTSSRAAVFYVAAELERRHYIALPTTRNSEAIDIIASNDLTLRPTSIQVKSEAVRNNYFLVGKRIIQLNDQQLENIVYSFVEMNRADQSPPRFFIVPGRVVRELTRHDVSSTGSEWWYINKDDIRDYIDRWDIIDVPTGVGISGNAS